MKNTKKKGNLLPDPGPDLRTDQILLIHPQVQATLLRNLSQKNIENPNRKKILEGKKRMKKKLKKKKEKFLRKKKKSKT